MEEATARELIEAYLRAFERREMEQCMDCFNSDATLEWLTDEYRGKFSIEEWHKDRFAAGLKILRVDEMNIYGDVATVRLTVTSKPLVALQRPSLGGVVSVKFQNGKIHGVKVAARVAVAG